jgi:DNA-binding beta-propeller fold protein YncE
MTIRTATDQRAGVRLLAALAACVAWAACAGSAWAQAPSFQVETAFGGDRLVAPSAITTDPAGRVFVTDTATHRVDVFDNASAGNAYITSFGVNDGLQQPSGIAIDNRNRIYVADAARAIVLRFSSLVEGAEVIRVLGEPGTEVGEFGDPRHLATDPRPNVYVADRANVRVQWIVATGIPIGAFGVGDINPPGFNSPHGIARERGAGRVYVTSDEPGAGGVRVFDPRGLYLRTVAGPGQGPGEVSGPEGVAVDRLGRAIVADTGHGRVQMFSSFADGSGLAAVSGALGTPSDVALAPGAILYVADASSGRILRLRYDDADGDGALDAVDTCRGLADPFQRDADRDGQGDECDPDDDADGLEDGSDPCPRSVRGPDTNNDGCTDPRSRITGVAAASRRPLRVRGTASADRLGVARVELALARVSGGRCRWYADRGRFGHARACSSPAWLRARGTRSWSRRVPVARRGRYRVLSRAVQRGGLVEQPGSRANVRTFSLR